jgi:flavin-dependent dehydrogenase
MSSVVNASPFAAQQAIGRTYDALVIGGGLAGSSLAISLAKAGRDVLLIEKSGGAHPKVCGEFLSHEALLYLDALGVDLDSLGAVPIEFVRLAEQGTLAVTRLPFPSRSLSRERLDEALLERATACGVSILRQCRVRALERARSWCAHTDTGQSFAGEAAFLATGKHDLYGWNRPAGRQNDLLAFKMYWRLSASERAALERHVELVLFPGGYAGLQPIEDGKANLCLLVRQEMFKKLGGRWPALLAHITGHSDHLKARLAGATALWERPLSLSSIPYGYVREQAQDGPWRLGDQSAVIPSFAGDGMSIALHSARLAAAMYLSGSSANQYQRSLAKDVGRQVSLATWIARALLNPLACSMLRTGAKLWPGGLAHVASSTRIRPGRLLDGV